MSVVTDVQNILAVLDDRQKKAYIAGPQEIAIDLAVAVPFAQMLKLLVTKRATEVPKRSAELCLSALRLCRSMAERGMSATITDAGVGALMARAGVHGAVYNVQINLGSISDAAWVSEQRASLSSLQADADVLEAEVRGLVEQALAGEH